VKGGTWCHKNVCHLSHWFFSETNEGRKSERGQLIQAHLEKKMLNEGGIDAIQ